MEAKELMVGNYYEWTEDEEEKDAFLQVDDFYSLLAIEENFQYFKPIPLNEEWLVKFGAAKIDGDFTLTNDLFKGGYFMFVFTGDQVIYYQPESRDRVVLKNIKHVHSLQNLYFTLTQTELKIK